MKKILLIEDDTDLFSLLQYNLEKEGFLLTGLQTGRGAIELSRKVRPDLILLDIMLPDSDGLDICKGIRKDPFTHFFIAIPFAFPNEPFGAFIPFVAARG